MSSLSLLETARALAPLFEREAAASEAAGELTPATVSALSDAGLFGLMVPSSLGGSEADAVTALEVLAEVCRADGSTGWALLANVTSTAFAAAYCGDSAVKEMFVTGGRPPIHAGQFAPRGTAEPVAGGYRVAGRYSFASGSSHAGYLAGGALAGDQMLAVYVPKERAVVLGNWDVMGLAGTASVDYEIPEQVVDAEWTFSLLGAEPLRGGPVYRLGVLSLTAIGHAAFALGIGQRAIEEITAIAGGKTRLGALPIREQQLFLHDFAMHEAALQAARSWTIELFGRAQSCVDAGSMPDAVLTQRLRQATTYATRVAADAVRFAYTWSGSDGLRNPSALGRCFRDMHAATQHLFVDNNTLTQAAQVLLDGS